MSTLVIKWLESIRLMATAWYGLIYFNTLLKFHGGEYENRWGHFMGILFKAPFLWLSVLLKTKVFGLRLWSIPSIGMIYGYYLYLSFLNHTAGDMWLIVTCLGLALVIFADREWYWDFPFGYMAKKHVTWVWSMYMIGPYAYLPWFIWDGLIWLCTAPRWKVYAKATGVILVLPFKLIKKGFEKEIYGIPVWGYLLGLAILFVGVWYAYVIRQEYLSWKMDPTMGNAKDFFFGVLLGSAVIGLYSWMCSIENYNVLPTLMFILHLFLGIGVVSIAWNYPEWDSAMKELVILNVGFTLFHLVLWFRYMTYIEPFNRKSVLDAMTHWVNIPSGVYAKTMKK